MLLFIHAYTVNAVSHEDHVNSGKTTSSDQTVAYNICSTSRLRKDISLTNKKACTTQTDALPASSIKRASTALLDMVTKKFNRQVQSIEMTTGGRCYAHNAKSPCSTSCLARACSDSRQSINYQMHMPSWLLLVPVFRVAGQHTQVATSCTLAQKCMPRGRL